VVLFDMHSFCYQREQKTNWFDDEKPEINLGTRFINRQFFSPLVDCFLEGVSGTRIGEHPMRVGENELFPGGYITRKFAKKYNRQVLVLAIEYKKIFMDERTGEIHKEHFDIVKNDFLRTRDQIMDLL
ncbi:MAG: N-formylglutamate amidohydrolase, partial [Bacteroidales bacterium]|nr:N-formylglutamate amidohydrolase [Bacteroidales bacterium]